MDYWKAVSEGSVTDALNSVNTKLTQAVIDGEVECLPSLYTHRAIWYLKLQMLRKALKDLESAVKLDPASVDARVLLVKCLRQLKRSDEAATHITQLKERKDDHFGVSALALAEMVSLFTEQDKPNGLMIEAVQPSNGHASTNGASSVGTSTQPKQVITEKKDEVSNDKAAKADVKSPSSPPDASVKATSTPMSQTATKKASAPAPVVESRGRTVSKSGNTVIEEVIEEPATSTSSPPPTQPRKAKQSKTSASKSTSNSKTSQASATAASTLSDVENMSMSGHSYLQLIQSHNIISQCIEQINAGKLDVAEGALGNVLKEQPKNFDALVARGTCRALKGELATAEADFTKAIEIRPSHADVWKRRAQARGARGNLSGAAEDLQQALKRLDASDEDGRIDTLFESAMLQHKMRDFRRAHAELLELVRKKKDHKQALSMLGLTATAMGNIEEGIKYYKAALRLDENFKDAWVNIFQSYKESGQTRQAEEAFLKIIALDTPQNRSLHSYRMMGHMRQCMGQHYKAVDILTKAMQGMNGSFQKMEIIFLRGACYHAMGRLKEAHADYERCLQEELNPVTAATETKQFQALAYYQRELTLYVHKVQDKPVSSFCIDKDLDPMFKEHWSKQVMPTKTLLERCKPLLPQGAAFPPEPRPLPSPPPIPALTALVDVAENIGTLLQYSHQGFLSNARQQRAAGFAAIELAQKVLEDVRERRRGSSLWVDSLGASGGPGGSGRHQFEWRDAMDVIVKWRQLAEPNDQVLWVDLLTPEEFNKGFGSHTPMYSGQTKCVRYYMNFERASNLHKDIILKQGYAFDGQNHQVAVTGDKAESLKAAKTAWAAWDVIGTDSWVVVPIQSKFRSGVTMEGTRLTLTKFPASHQPDAHEFSIRTPVTPARWKDFDSELSLCWNAILEAYIAGDLKRTAECILYFVYFWYNFMPLARGSAAVGYTTILSLFWAFDMPISVNIPKDYQTDWEAMLTQDPDDFVKELARWMFPPKACPESNTKNVNEEKLAKYGDGPNSLPIVLETLGTLRKRFYALNYNTPAQKKK